MDDTVAHGHDPARAASTAERRREATPGATPGYDPRPSLMQAWELSGGAAGAPTDPFAPPFGHAALGQSAALAQSAAWADALAPGPAGAPTDPFAPPFDHAALGQSAALAQSAAWADALAPGPAGDDSGRASLDPTLGALTGAPLVARTPRPGPAPEATRGSPDPSGASPLDAITPAGPATRPTDANASIAAEPTDATRAAPTKADPAPDRDAGPTTAPPAGEVTKPAMAPGDAATVEGPVAPADGRAPATPTAGAVVGDGGRAAETPGDAAATGDDEQASAASADDETAESDPTSAAPPDDAGQTEPAPAAPGDGGEARPATASPGEGAAPGVEAAETASGPGAAGGRAARESAPAEPAQGAPESGAPPPGGGGASAQAPATDAGGGGADLAVPDLAVPDAPADEPAADEAQAEDEARDDQEEDQDLEAEMDAIGADVPEPAIGGGSGGGSPIPEPTSVEAPDVSQQAPEAGLAQLQGLRPDLVAGALGGVGAAVGQAVSDKRAALAAAPPTRETRGDGQPPEAAPPLDAPAPTAADTGDSRGAPDVPVATPAPTPEPAGTPPAERATAPAVQGGEGGELSEEDTRQMSASIANLPTRDPAAHVTAGPAPAVPRAGSADPARAHQDKAALERRVTTAAADARREATQPMGERQIEVTAPAATLTAQIPTGGAAEPAAAPPLPGPEQAEMIGLIAGKQAGERVDAALAGARADMDDKRRAHAETEQQKRADADAAIGQLERDAAAEQTREKAATQAEVAQLRGQWQAEADQQSGAARREADAQVRDGMRRVEAEQQKGEREADKAHTEGEAEAKRARDTGEAEAEKLKRDGKKESSGFFGWLASKAKAFFDRVKKGITAALRKARAAVKSAIDKAKKLAAAAIERARKAIVGAIELVGKALVAIGDRLLAGFPALRDRFRKAIQDRVQRATDAVNAAAKRLNDGVQQALDGLGKGLDAALGLLEKGLHFIVDGVSAVVQSAIKSAQGLVNGVLGFALLIKDIAAGPGQWISNLGAAVVDGIKNHLWAAFKVAVKGWFESKLMEVLGIGGMVIRTLIEGGFDMPRIAQSAWDGIKAAIPIALISILVEKLVSMIVPAAGAVIAILEGLQAAWGTVSRVIAAFAAFMTFLKMVRSGNAGPAFAQALAAGAIVVLDFVSNWLLKKLRKAARAVGKKLKGIAKKLARKLERKGNKGKNSSKTKGKGKKDKDKNKDAAAARREAKRAARKGWGLAQRKTSKQLRKKAEVEQALRAAEGTRGGVKIKLDAQTKGTTWTVKATATKKGKRATATEGRGWIAKGPSGGQWMAASDLTRFNKGLIDGIFTGAKKDDADGKSDLKASYKKKKARVETLRKKAQAKLDKKLRGLRVTAEVEPFSGVEKDKKMRTTVRVAPNSQEETEEVPLDGDAFAKRFQVAQPSGAVEVEAIGAGNVRGAGKSKVPMASPRERIPGFVVNMTAMPNSVKPDTARRYGLDAWSGDDRDLGPARTAVVAGVNSFKSIDNNTFQKTRKAIAQAPGKVMPLKGMAMAIFGFVWEPAWSDDGKATTLEKVRAEYKKLPADERKSALAGTEGNANWKAGGKLPYGVFRETVLASRHTKKMVKGLSSSGFDPIHILSQDDDGQLTAASGKGVLAEYSAVLAQMKAHPLLTIGGYRFDDFDWDPNADDRTKQLTTLANELDRAIRKAIASVHPEMLYPTEPNMLVKAKDKRDRGGIYDDPGLKAQLGQNPGLYGTGKSEGRNLKLNAQQTGGLDKLGVAYAPTTSIVTSPDPGDLSRQLTVTPDMVRKAETGELYKERSGAGKIKASYKSPYYALSLQSQSQANVNNMANEFGKVNAASNKTQSGLKKDVFGVVDSVGKDMAKDPTLGKDYGAQQKAAVSAQAQKLADKNPGDKQAIERAERVVKAVIDVMTVGEFRQKWSEIKALLDAITKPPQQT